MNNKVVLVTGASSGIGKETVIRLLREDYKVYAAARRTDKMADLKDFGAKILFMDVTDDNSVKKAVDDLIKEEGRIDVLFSNAGYASYGNIEDVPMDEIMRQFDVNVFGNARVLKAVLPHMRKQRFGRIIITSSMVGKFSSPVIGWYAATKHALEAMADALRSEVKDIGIDVIKIQPGVVKTEFSNIALDRLKNVDAAAEYKELAEICKKHMSYVYSKCEGPEKTADIIVQAIKTNKPKASYATTSDAKKAIFMKRIVNDESFDKMVLNIYKVIC